MSSTKLNRGFGTMLFVGALMVYAAAVASATSTEKLHSLDPHELVPALAAEQTPDAPFPKNDGFISDTELVPSSLRHIGTSTYGQHWAAVAADDDICILTEMRASGGEDLDILGVACTPPASFFERGVSFRLEGGGQGVVSHLLPADLEPHAVREAIDSRQNAQPSRAVEMPSNSSSPVVVMDTEAADALGEVTIPRAEARAVTL